MEEKLILNSIEDAEIISVRLSPDETPIAYENRVRCLMLSGLSREEAENFSLEDLIEKCYNNFFKAWHEEYEHWGDDEDAIREELHHNQYEGQLYYENGEAYAGPLNKIE